MLQYDCEHQHNRKYTKEGVFIMKKWICKPCGYIHEGDHPPDECPLCGVGPEEFEEVEE